MVMCMYSCTTKTFVTTGGHNNFLLHFQLLQVFPLELFSQY